MKKRYYYIICILVCCLLFCGMYLDMDEIKQGIVSGISSGREEYVSDDLEPSFDFMRDKKYCETAFDDLTSSEIDIRYCDVSDVDFTKFPKDIINKLSFNSKTIWPSKMPKWFNLEEINKIGKTPGLNVKELHARGITGRGVGLAIIDQPLSSHQEYKNNVKYYKNFTQEKKGTMHGTAVSSIAVGKNIGVAPGADLYFIAAEFIEDDNEIFDATPIADAINYILELNKTLSVKNKISVISISRGFSENDNGHEDFQAALQNAEKQNILVLTTNVVRTVSRDGYFANPNNLASYTRPPYWWEDEIIPSLSQNEKILVPTDYRITACETGEQDYAYYVQGGLSWGVPYLAGVAALAKQAKPNLKMKDFISLVRKTADTVTVKDSTGKPYQVKYFINPKHLIDSLQN